VTDYYSVDAANKLLWVNQGTNAAPTAGQANPYTLFSYNTNGVMSQRDRRYTTGGPRQVYDFLWDGDDRLRLVNEGGTKRFSGLYDGDGLRVKKEDTRAGALQTHNYSYSPYGLMHESNPTTVYTPGFGHRSNGINTYYHHDWLGSSRWTSDSTGNTFPQALRFDAFGNRTATQAPASWHPTDLQFAGDWGYQTEWASSTEPGLALNYLEQRYYDPAVGRFISPDPIGLAGGLNLYGYCGNDPVNCVDPTGEIVETLWDIATIGLDASMLWQDLHECDRNWAAITGDVISLGFDMGAALIPFVPAGMGHINRLSRGLVHAPAVGRAIEAARAASSITRESRTVASYARYATSSNPYDHLPEPRKVGEGKDFTKSTHDKVLAENRKQNGGKLVSDRSGKVLDSTNQSRKGVPQNMNEAVVDHYKAKKKGGTNSPKNARVIGRDENGTKGARDPDY
jgi:RHS repeat-associated protein